ncbi:MAG: nucleoside deaminase [Spirochaetota bacterium]
MHQQHELYLRKAFDIAYRARKNGNHPFGALLVDAEGRIVLEAENTVVTQRDCTGHAETNLMRMASARFDKQFLSKCILYTSTEPCAMCAGAIYWGGVGTVVFGLKEKSLHELTGDHSENPTLSLPCRQVFSRGSRDVTVIGPLLEEEAIKLHEGFWRE